MNVLNIPQCWITSPLSSLISTDGLISDGDWVESKDQDPEGVVRLIQLADIGDGDFRNKSNRYMSHEKANALRCTYLKEGDVLVARMPDPLGRACIFPGINQDAVTVVDICLIRTSHNSAITNKLLKYWINSPIIRNQIELNATGTTRKRITRKKLEEFLLPLPPMAEQQLIVDKLDNLLSQVESIKARLERIPEILKQFRQSVLAAAVSGKLTKDLERGVWKELKLEAVASNIVDCPHSTPKWSESGKYCVRTTGFNPFYLDLSQQGFVSDEVYQERIQRLEPKPNDILYSREGTVGIACQIPDGVELCLGQRMVLIRAGESCNSKYLTMVLNSDHILSIVRSMTIGSTAPRVNMKDIRNYPIPIPTMDEQNEIVLRVERLFRSIEVIGEQVQSTLERVNNLTQSILDKAFRGELTVEWRKANPDLISGENSAEALLERIKAERTSVKSATKRARAKT
ncbi:hypothetical protein CAT67_02015 [Acinetobacter baumannii]|uniref:restriction endonuclease subunit S n=1 Tax=Acinetobacter baumannii TaxID=470 RepID=UPI0002D05584|nr:restriction endonuclease subunit S [Acinetobacter baumannii]ENW42614.1 hypothetical protein F919_02738 [Acinetobacter baumannii NIPH 329]OTU04439.1 hypothetical protein CAT67_02015 [Acinetobacter baumannii]HDX6160225.1 restriction endonuclease subunit S [Acinetobacter baumannii]